MIGYNYNVATCVWGRALCSFQKDGSGHMQFDYVQCRSDSLKECFLTLSQMTDFRLFQTERGCRR